METLEGHGYMSHRRVVQRGDPDPGDGPRAGSEGFLLEGDTDQMTDGKGEGRVEDDLAVIAEHLRGWGEHEWSDPGVDGAGVGRATNKLTYGLLASEQPRAFIFGIEPQFLPGQRRPTKVWPLPT